MKKIVLSILISVSLLLLASPVYAKEESISSYASKIELKDDSTVNIREEISYYFPYEKHGIYWTYPYLYKVSGFRRPTLFTINSVEYYKKDQPSYKYSEYEESKENGWVTLKIGDADTYVSGDYVYVIDYTLKYTGVSFFDDHDELYINIIGPGWEVPILSSQATISIPGDSKEIVCYTGSEGSTEKNCKFSEGNKVITTSTTTPLLSYEAYTVAISFPKGIMKDTTSEQIRFLILANLGVFIFIPVIFLMVYLVKKYGRNKKITIIPNYTPNKGLDSMLAGVLYSKKWNNKYVTAGIIELAINGYLKIKQVKNNKYELEKLKEIGENEKEYIKDLYNGLFKNKDIVELKDLPNTFFTTVQQIFGKIDKELISRDWFSKKRRNIQSAIITLSIIACISGFVLTMVLIEYAAIGWGLGILLSGVVGFISLAWFDIRSEDGNKEYYELLGLKMYINTAEKHRIEFHNDPKKYNEIFEKLLPYAMIFGLEKKWADEFKDIYNEPPSWYEGNFNTFNAYYLANSLGHMNSTVVSKSNPPANYGSSSGYRSSGWSSGSSGFSGGFSGGGGGGSGGGSW